MKRSYVYILGLLIAGFLLATVSQASADDRYARLRHIEGDVVLYPSDKDRPTEAMVNAPVLDGDELETQNGRAEVSFRNGIVVRLGDYSALRIESSYSPMIIQLIEGTVFVDSHIVDRFGDELEVRAGDSQVFLINEGNLRVDMGKEGSVRVTTLDGEAEVRANGSRVLLETNERTYIDPGNQPESPESFARNYDELDDWNQSRIDSYARNDYRDERYVDDSLYYDSYDLDYYGDWRTYGTYGNVWVPRVGAGWRPYYDGRWMYTGGSYFWVSYEPWGWAPYHYGRWGWNLDFGWYWIPGYTFAPAWVSWYDYGDYIGWCALGYYGYPVYYHDRDYYQLPYVQKQKNIGVNDSWTFVKKASLGDPSIKKISASGSELKNIQIDKTRVMKQPSKAVSTYVSGKGQSSSTASTKLVKPSQKYSAPRTAEKSLNNWTNSEKVRSYGDRDYNDRSSAGSSTKQYSGSQKTIQTPSKSNSSSTKGSSTSSGSSGSIKKSTPPSSSGSSNSGSKKSSSSGSSVTKKPSPPNYNRDEQFDRYLPGSTKLFNDSGSPSQRDREFNTQSYRDRNFDFEKYRNLNSNRSNEAGPGDDDRLPWFRDPRSYEESGNAEVSPRYMEGARKFFERYEATRNTESAGENGGSPRYEPRSESRPSYGSSDRGSGSGSSVKSYGGSSTKSNGSSGRSHGSAKPAPKSNSGSSKKPH